MYRRNDPVDGYQPDGPVPPAAGLPGHPDPAWDDDRLGQASWRDHLDPGWQPGPGHRHDDHGQAGHQLGGYDQGGYDQGGHQLGGYDTYGQTGYGHDGYAPLPTASYEVDATGGYGRDQPDGYDHAGSDHYDVDTTAGYRFDDNGHRLDHGGHDQDHTGAHDATGWLDGDDGHHEGRADDDTVVHRASRRRGRRTDDVDDADGPDSGRRRRGVPGPVALAALVAVLLVAIGGGAALLRSGFSDGTGTGTDQGGVAASGGTSVTDPPLDTTGATAEPQIGDPQARAELGPAPTPTAQPSSAAPPPPDPDPVRTTEPAAPAPARTTPAAPARTSAAPPSSATGGGNLEQQVLTIVNQERGANGCKPVTINTRLSEASRLHSEDQAATDNMSHEGSDGSSPWERAERADYEHAIGENVAAGYPTAAAVMNGWMNSPGHRANILNCDAVAMGVGTATSADGTLYWTQMFGSVA